VITHSRSRNDSAVVSRERRRVVGILRFACVSMVKDIHEKGISRLQDGNWEALERFDATTSL
jgi:hypothetical protein